MYVNSSTARGAGCMRDPSESALGQGRQIMKLWKSAHCVIEQGELHKTSMHKEGDQAIKGHICQG